MVEIVEIGEAPDDGLGDSLRLAFQKINRNFEELSMMLADSRATQTGLTWPAEFVPRYVEQRSPDQAPERLGAIWVDTDANAIYIAVGTDAAQDWRRIVLEGDR